MALSDLVTSLKAVNPFSNRKFANSLFTVLDEVVEKNLVADEVDVNNINVDRIQAGSLDVGGTVAPSYIGGGYVAGTALFGPGTQNGVVENVRFDGLVTVSGGVWTFINCSFRAGINVSTGDAQLEGGYVLGNAASSGAATSAKLTSFENYPTGSWILVFPDTTP